MQRAPPRLGAVEICRQFDGGISGAWDGYLAMVLITGELYWRRKLTTQTPWRATESRGARTDRGNHTCGVDGGSLTVAWVMRTHVSR